MNPTDLFLLQAVSAAGPAFAFGFILGWALALTHLSSSSSHNRDE